MGGREQTMRRKYWKQNNNKPWKGPNGFTKKQRENKGRKKEKDKKRQKKNTKRMNWIVRLNQRLN